MPALSSLAGTTILVTGGTGYIGAAVIEDLLLRGATVRAATRKKEGGEDLASKFSEFASKYSYVVVPVIEANGAFNDAVQDVDGIVHVASPATFGDGHPREWIEPAIKGTVGILESAHKYGSKVQRVVITGSVSALGRLGLEPGPPVTHDETSYNEDVIKRVEDQGINALPGDKYSASKTLADKATWEWVKNNQPKFDVTMILPSLVLGPWSQPVFSKSQLGTSLSFLLGALKLPGKTPPESTTALMSSIDIRDVAAAHSLSLVTEKAGNERIIISRGLFSWQEIYNALNDTLPSFPEGSIPIGEPEAEIVPGPVTYSQAKVFEIFPGFKTNNGPVLGLRTLTTTVVDFVRALDSKGWLAEE